ncbi:hypothetical protein BN2475_630051 [Paraburkholderia ribeironis]|uniref:Uncharacterized protein n=1 Tax=Paraburkholderia ribeironis TaxID=1247936 RepID=A0A1N7SFM8_9BURK|nr:hypothetical protein BN2475_630051 [Paraburkholderia ribeironis]
MRFTMFDETAARLMEMRNGYDYPRAYMQYASGRTAFKVTPDASLNLYIPRETKLRTRRSTNTVPGCSIRMKRSTTARYTIDGPFGLLHF